MATYRFLENLTLASLVAPVTEAEFQTRYWEQKPLVVHRNDPDYYGDLFTVDDFDKSITSSPHSGRASWSAKFELLRDTLKRCIAIAASARRSREVRFKPFSRRQSVQQFADQRIDRAIPCVTRTNMAGAAFGCLLAPQTVLDRRGHQDNQML